MAEGESCGACAIRLHAPAGLFLVSGLMRMPLLWGIQWSRPACPSRILPGSYTVFQSLLPSLTVKPAVPLRMTVEQLCTTNILVCTTSRQLVN